jgi:hypothetical protein
VIGQGRFLGLEIRKRNKKQDKGKGFELKKHNTCFW